MKVIRKNKIKEVDFATLKPGDCFEVWDKLYIKSQADQQATGLEDGESRVNMDGVGVILREAEIQIID